MQNVFNLTGKRLVPASFVLLMIISASVVTSCKDPWSNKETVALKTDSLKYNYISLADSISYGVVVKNRDGADQWQKKWLSSFEREEFIDFIFEGVYSGELQPYDYFSDKPINIAEVKKLENQEDFDRTRIGKIQFEERWFFNTEHLSMVKEVYSVMFAYEVYKDDGSFRGYKPAFKVRLQPHLEK